MRLVCTYILEAIKTFFSPFSFSLSPFLSPPSLFSLPPSLPLPLSCSLWSQVQTTSDSTYGRFQMVQSTHVVHTGLVMIVHWLSPPLSEEPDHGSPYGSASEALPHLVLPGHRSIVNQVRYSRTHHLLCSSGVEKIVKVIHRNIGCVGGNLALLILTQNDVRYRVA